MPIIKKTVQYYSSYGTKHSVQMMPKTIGDAIVAATTPENGTSPFSIVDYAVPTNNTSATYTNYYCRLQWRNDTNAYLYIYAGAENALCYGLTEVASGITTPSNPCTNISTNSGSGSKTVTSNIVIAYNSSSCFFALNSYSNASLDLTYNVGFLHYQDTSNLNRYGYYHKYTPVGEYSLSFGATNNDGYLYNRSIAAINSYPPALVRSAFIMPYFVSTTTIGDNTSATLTNDNLSNCYYIQSGEFASNSKGLYSIGIHDFIKVSNLLLQLDM